MAESRGLIFGDMKINLALVTRASFVAVLSAAASLAVFPSSASAGAFPSQKFQIRTFAGQCLTGVDQNTGLGVVVTQGCRNGDTSQTFTWDTRTSHLQVSKFPAWCVTGESVPMTLEGDILLAPCDPSHQYDQGWEQRPDASRGVEIYNTLAPDWHIEASSASNGAPLLYSGAEKTNGSFFQIIPV